MNKVRKLKNSESASEEVLYVKGAPVGELGGAPILSLTDNAGVLALAMGAPIDEYDGNFMAAIRWYVSPELAEEGIKIASLDFPSEYIKITLPAPLSPRVA